MSLQIQQLHTSIDETEIIHGLDLEIQQGEVHVIMGPNGSGKSTLANTLMGHPKYEITSGSVTVDGVEVTEMEPHERAQHGLFLSMQYPPEIAGVTIQSFLRTAYNALHEEQLNPIEFQKLFKAKMAELKIDPEFAKRHLNVGFSGGEKKRAEILQLAILQPRYAILDETDSGLDVDALRIVSEGINSFRSATTGVLLITHYNRILEYVQPDVVHIMREGRIVMTGGPELALRVEKEGYDGIN